MARKNRIHDKKRNNVLNYAPITKIDIRHDQLIFVRKKIDLST